MNPSKIYNIAKFTYVENLKKKNFIILFLFIFIVLGSGVLFSMLSPDQEIRVILDLGTAAIEMFAFLSASFIAVRLILQEMEEKTVYLILSRPVCRATYILGRFFGIISVIASYIIIMALSLIVMLLLKGWTFNSYIILISFTIFLKILIITSFSIFLSLISTSSASSFVTIFFLWALGHFAGELKHLNRLLKDSGIILTPLLQFLYYVLPNFSFLNYKDTFHITNAGFSAYFYPAGYAIFYSAVIITLSIILFNKKEL